MTEGDGGKPIMQKASEWKNKVEVAIDIGGSSYNNLEKFMEAFCCARNQKNKTWYCNNEFFYF